MDHKSKHVEEAVRELIDIFNTIYVSKDTKTHTPSDEGTGPENTHLAVNLCSSKPEVVSCQKNNTAEVNLIMCLHKCIHWLIY